MEGTCSYGLAISHWSWRVPGLPRVSFLGGVCKLRTAKDQLLLCIKRKLFFFKT